MSIATTTDRRQSFGDLLSSEWIKIRSVRSTVFTLLVTAVLTIGISSLGAFAIAANWNHAGPGQRLAFDPTSRSLSGVLLGQLALGVLGILVFTAEVATGTISATFTAASSRSKVLVAKIVMFAIVAIIVAEIVSFASFFVGQAILSGTTPTASLGGTNVLRAVAGTGLYMALLALFALGLGVIVRHTAGAITTFVALVLVLPLLVTALPTSLSNDINKFLPFTIGRTLMSVHSQPNTFSAWAGLAILAIYTVIIFLIANWRLTSRDA
ncbi:ABC transporter permease subunit [Ferrimicrobium acidiphilum]|uniref:ABC-2 family transporter protein n=1 Tax=Ferrimicrobium acidiphilum DSM 19497 TaxID=1121877 RepID=A0A0D8FXF6_9ACTN|nr:ABC transporter permease subunit [Ferrimicrobium acidiphilum]KJE76957.1 ABC-2 family transporter protein [Ferrimicrobium acidiphilum DSM 19497]